MNVMSRETVLRRYVDSVKREYDYVLLDCRPSLGMLVINALSASDYVLVDVYKRQERNIIPESIENTGFLSRFVVSFSYGK